MNANTRVSVTQYDAVCRRALRDGCSISELMRRGLTKVLEADDEDEDEDR